MTSEVVIAIGDIHGRLDLLEPLLDHAETFVTPQTKVVVVTLGDYVDRGFQSKQVIDRLLAGPKSPSVRYVHVGGNHDTWMLGAIKKPRGPQLREWLEFGGVNTLMSYDVEEEDMFNGRFVEKIPDSHVVFLRRLHAFYPTDTHIFVHAGLAPGVELHDQDRDVMQMIREEFLESDFDFGRIIVHGHSIRSRPQIRNNRIGIDTGADENDRLTAVVLELGRPPSFFQCRQTQLGEVPEVTTDVAVDVIERPAPARPK